jgi:hypothetical protein
VTTGDCCGVPGQERVAMRRSSVAVTILLAVLVAAAATACGGMRGSTTSVPAVERAPSSTVRATSASTGPSSAGPLSLPLRQPIEIYRFTDQEELWQAWIKDGYVLWMQSAGQASHTALAYSASPAWDTIFRFVDLRELEATSTTTAGGIVQQVPGVRLPAPKLPSSPTYSMTVPLAWAAVLSNRAGEPFKLVWAAPPRELSENYFFQGLSSWTAGAKETAQVLPESIASISGLAFGDAVAMPVPVASFKPGQSDPSNSRNWQTLFMLTANLVDPIQVDSAAPRLPDSALAGISPYFALFQVDAAGRASTRIFDLRTGKALPLDMPSPPQPLPLIAGHRAAWLTETGDVYLADLDTCRIDKVPSLRSHRTPAASVALGTDWLVALRLSPSTETMPSTTQPTPPSQHPGADLIALHLPDLRQVEIPAVVAQGEIGGVQVSGDLVLLQVSPAIELIPHNEPAWIALRVIDLEDRP